MSAVLESPPPRRFALLLAQCAEPVAVRRPAFDRLRDKVGVKLARALVNALAGNQRRSARRG